MENFAGLKQQPYFHWDSFTHSTVSTASVPLHPLKQYFSSEDFKTKTYAMDIAERRYGIKQHTTTWCSKILWTLNATL